MKRIWLAIASILLVTSACESGAGTAIPRRNVRPYTGPAVGGSSHPFGLKWDWSQIETLSPYITANSGGSTFFEFAWCEVEATQRTRDWAVVDRAVDSATRLGYRMGLKIRVGACWATGTREAAANQHRVPSRMPEDLLQYSNFVSEAVKRYAARGVTDFGFENEVNARNFWRGSAEDYGRLTEIAARAAHQAAEKIRVFDAGLSSPAWGVIVTDDLLARDQPEEALAFYQRYFARRQFTQGSLYPQVSSEAALRSALNSTRAKRHREYFAATVKLVRDGTVDAFALHYYDAWTELPRVMKLLRSRLGDSVIIDAWEAGVAWPGDTYDADVHARETLQLLATLLAEGVGRVIYLPVSFSPGRGRESEVVRPLVNYEDGQARAAGEAYTSLVDASRGATRWARVTRAGLSGLAFDLGDATALVVWSKDGKAVTATSGIVSEPRVIRSERPFEEVVAKP